jgi:hypothetical protein
MEVSLVNNTDTEPTANMDSHKAGINMVILTILKGIIQEDIFQDKESRNLDQLLCFFYKINGKRLDKVFFCLTNSWYRKLGTSQVAQ